MTRLKIILPFLLFLFLSGCSNFYMICSLNPFYLDQNITLNHEIEGKWKAIAMPSKTDLKDKNSLPWRPVDTASTWKIERYVSKEHARTKRGKDSIYFKPSNYYMVKLIGYHSDSLLYKFKMVLFRVNKNLYADFVPLDNTGLERSLFASESYFSMHTLARVTMINHKLGFSWLGDEYMKEMIEHKRVRVSNMWVQSERRLLLTGTPEQLTAMIERYASEPRFIDWESQKAMLNLNLVK